jgi:hypothetical protein
MKRHIGHIGFLLMSFLLAATVAAQTELSGEVGVDLKNLSYETLWSDSTSFYTINRGQSNYYMNLFLGGPLVNRHFATYSTSMKLYGAYFRSASDFETVTDNVNPGIGGFFGQVTLLPSRPYPLRVYLSKGRNHPLQYEPNNRSDRDRLQPTLSIIRRYQDDRQSAGAAWQLMPSNDFRLRTEYKQGLVQSERIYDFGEDNDIWVSYIMSPARPWDTVFTVLFGNELPDTVDIVVINRDSILSNPGFPPLIINDLPPDRTQTVYLFPGETEIQIGSRTFNPYYNVLNVDSNMVIAIKYENPAAPNDLDQELKVFTNFLKLGNDNRRVKNETIYEYADRREMVQKQLSFIHNFSNMFRYQMSGAINADAFFSFQENRTRIDTVSLQWNRVMMNQTTLNYFNRRGIAGTLSHVYSRNRSHIANPSLPPSQADSLANDTLVSTLNSFAGRMTIPTRTLNYRMNLRGNVSLQSDNSGFVNNQYIGEMINSLENRWIGVHWQPMHLLKYGYTAQKNPTKKSNDFESKLAVVGTKSTNFLGDIRMKGEYTYRKRWDESASEVRNKYIIDFLLIRRFGPSYRLSLLTNQEWELIGGSAPTVGSGSSSKNKTIRKSMFKIDGSGAPHKNLYLSGNFMIVNQGENSIKKYGFSINTQIPYLKVPIKSLLLIESRKLGSQDPQNQIVFDTKINHRIRKITMVLRYVYRREELIFETYSFHEIQGKISRQFGVF